MLGPCAEEGDGGGDDTSMAPSSSVAHDERERKREDFTFGTKKGRTM